MVFVDFTKILPEFLQLGGYHMKVLMGNSQSVHFDFLLSEKFVFYPQGS